MLILGGLVAVLGTGSKVHEIISQFPVLLEADPRAAEVKAICAIIIFVYAFFQFSWSAWQYNILAIIMGGAPGASAGTEAKTHYIATASSVAALAGDSYNNGIRAYYFSGALMAWFVDTRLFVVATLFVTFILFRREFASPRLQPSRIFGGLTGSITAYRHETETNMSKPLVVVIPHKLGRTEAVSRLKAGADQGLDGPEHRGRRGRAVDGGQSARVPPAGAGAGDLGGDRRC